MKAQYIKILQMIIDARDKYTYDIINISFMDGSDSYFPLLLEAIEDINSVYSTISLQLMDKDSNEYKEYKIKVPKYTQKHVIKIIRHKRNIFNSFLKD